VPEGDTILRTAQALDQALAGRVLVRFEAPRLLFRPFPEGTSVDGVEAVGKHCLVHFDDGRTLHTHLRMTGSWHLYRPGERWQRAAASMRAVIEVPDRIAVCFAAPLVELTTAPPVAHLGPDLCRPGPDLDEAVRRMGQLAPPDGTIGEALLDQRVAAGIGNIWKSESCFACGIDPFTPLELVDDGDRRRLLGMASRQLRGERGPLAVYGRRDAPCRRCGTPIRWAPQGAHRRGTYWCPACQPARRGSGAG
jgi:endonuclease-8